MTDSFSYLEPVCSRESWGWRSSHCRAEETSPKRAPGELGLVSRGSKGLRFPLKSRYGSLGWVSLTLGMGYLFMAAPAKHSHCSLPWTRGISSLPPFLTQGALESHAGLLSLLPYLPGTGLLSRPCRKRRPSAREDGGVSGVSSSCGARGGFLPRHDEDHHLRRP